MKRRMTFLMCLLLPLALSATAWATGTVSYTAASGNYNTAANWSGGTVPVIDDNAYINNGSTVTLNAAATEPNVGLLWVGGTTGAAETTGGSFIIQNGAALTALGTYRVGSPNAAVVLQSGGTIRTSYFTMGGFDETNIVSDYYQLDAGALIADYAAYATAGGSTVNFGRNDTDTFVQNGGSLYIATPAYINIGYISTGSTGVGAVTLTNGSLVIPDQNSSNVFYVGRNGGKGTLTLNSASSYIYASYKMYIGANTGSVGTVNQNNGQVIVGNGYSSRSTGGTNAEFCVAFDNGNGTYNLNGGTLDIRYKARVSENGGNGVFNATGGTILMPNNTGGTFPGTNAQEFDVGYQNGTGLMNFGGSAYADLFSLYIGNPGGGAGTIATGTVNITGGLLSTRASVVVAPYASSLGLARGTLNVSGGTLAVGSKLRVGDSSDPNVPYGQMTVSNTGTVTVGSDLEIGYGKGKGTLNISGGQVTVSGKTYVSRINDSTQLTGGTSLMYMTGGSFIAPSGTSSPVYVGFRGTVNPGVNGTLNISNGYFRAGDLRLLDLDSNSATAGTANKAYLKIGANANVALLGDANSGPSFRIYNGGTSTVEMEIASGVKNSLLSVTNGTANLGTALATLVVTGTSVSGYRPGQGDTFTLISATGGSMTGSFKNITSNMVGQLLLDPNNPSGGYWPIFRGAVVGTNYVVTFQGAMAGDATGDNKVDSSDFGAIARNWMQSGKGWTDGDFSGDGTVDSTDFGALARNWGKTGLAPSAAPPEDAPLPEPATLALLSLGGLAILRRKGS